MSTTVVVARAAGRLQSQAGGGPAAPDRTALRIVAVERLLRAVVLGSVGLLLLRHAPGGGAPGGRHLAQQLGLGPSRGTGWLWDGNAGSRGAQVRRDGLIAMGCAALAAVEAYALGRRRRWGERLTVLSTSVLFWPELDGLAQQVSALGVVVLLLNTAVVLFLVLRLRRAPR